MVRWFHCLILSLFLGVSVTAFGDAGFFDFDSVNFNQPYQDSIETSVEDYQGMERFLVEAIARDPELKTEAPAIGLAISEIYLKNHDYQEAIWALDRSGHYAEAEKLSMAYENFLKTAEIISVEPLVDGVTRSLIVQYKNGLRAILKYPDPGSPQSNIYEVWTYELDRKLGFNLSPTAVARNIGGIDYAIIGFAEGAKNSGLDLTYGANRNHPDIYLLDFIIGQWDRRAENSMFAKNGRLFGIDNGRIGRPNYYKRSFDGRVSPSAQLLQNILKFPTDQNLEKFCHRYGLKFDFVAGKINEVKAALQSKAKQGKLRSFLRKDRLNSEKVGQSISRKFQEKINDYKNEILKRSKARKVAASNISSISVNADNLKIVLLRPEDMDEVIKNKDLAQIQEFYETTKFNKALRIDFLNKLVKERDSFDSDLKNQVSEMLIDDPTILPKIFEIPVYAMRFVPSNKNLENHLIEYVKSLDVTDRHKASLMISFIDQKINQSSDASKTVNELLDILTEIKMEKLFRHISVDVKLSGDAAVRLWNLYLINGIKESFPIGTFHDFFVTSQLTYAQQFEFEKRLSFLTKTEDATEILKLIEGSPNRFFLIQSFKNVMVKESKGILMSAYLNFKLSKNISFAASLQVISELTNKASKDVEQRLLGIFESYFPTEAWKVILLSVLQNNPTSVKEKLNRYSERKNYYKVDEIVFSLEPAAMKSYLIQSLKKTKAPRCEALFN